MREDHQCRTQCHQNTISGRRDDDSRTQCHQNTISGRRDDDSRTQCHQNTISGREDNQRGTPCHQNTISGRKDRGPPHLGLTKLLTSGRRGFICARWRCTPVASQTGWPRTLRRVQKWLMLNSFLVQCYLFQKHCFRKTLFVNFCWAQPFRTLAAPQVHLACQMIPNAKRRSSL